MLNIDKSIIYLLFIIQSVSSTQYLAQCISSYYLSNHKNLIHKAMSSEAYHSLTSH